MAASVEGAQTFFKKIGLADSQHPTTKTVTDFEFYNGVQVSRPHLPRPVNVALMAKEARIAPITDQSRLAWEGRHEPAI
jgi:hypothetical protein